MVFNSLEFIAFFPIAVLGYFAFPVRLRWVWLLAASVYFYGVAQPVYILQILAATAVAYVFAFQVEQSKNKDAKQRYLAIAICALVANLVAFKYTSFLNETFRSLTGWVGVQYPIPHIDILLPIGISFYTFQLISYLVDVFRGDKAERHFGVFALYVAFFPKLVAGPIERARNLLPQLHAPRNFSYEDVVAGMQLMTWGAFKKVVVADRISPYVIQVYDAPHAWDGVSLAFATWLYAFQLYFDFSGYTDMALGAARVMGFKLTQNFNRPYFATSIQDFWKRWHISLTSWLTDYIYTPLTRQKSFKIKFFTMMLIGLFVTFVVSGLWHGAAWTFVAWGALHGAYIVASLMLQKPWNQFVRNSWLAKAPGFYRWAKIVFTFTLVCFAYILFRANSLPDAFYIMTHLWSGWGDIKGSVTEVIWAVSGLYEFVLPLAGIAIIMLVELFNGGTGEKQVFAARPAWLRWSVYAAGVVCIALFGAYYDASQPFIYFRF